jgi:hypothetical protein
MTREYRRVRHEDLERWLADGWTPAVVVDGAVGVDCYAHTLGVVVVMRDAVSSAIGGRVRKRWRRDPWRSA